MCVADRRPYPSGMSLVDWYRAWHARAIPPFLRKILVVVFPPLFILLFVVAPILPAWRFPWQMGLGLGARLAIGVPFGALGAFLYLWTIVLFARAGGTQVPLVPTKRVVTTGPYAVSRNPMVTSALLMICGAAVLVGSWTFLVAGLLVPSPYLLYIKLFEEKELEARFGAEYVAYKRSTPFILPRWPRRRLAEDRARQEQ